MAEILDVALEFFESDGWPFTRLEGQPTLSMGFRGERGQWTCYAEVREEYQQFVFYSVCPVNAPEEKRPAAAEFLTRANYGLIVGNFEMDWDDGEIRYKTSIDVAGDHLSPALVRQLVYANVLMMDVYLPGIMLVLFGDIPPADVIEQVESSQIADRD